MSVLCGAREAPDDVAVIDLGGTRRTTWLELDRHVRQVAAGVISAGLGIDDGLAFICGNRAEVIEVMFGAIRGGVRGVPVNWHLTPAEAGYILENSGSRLVVCDEEHEGLARAAAAEAKGIEVLVVERDFASWRDSQSEEPPLPRTSGIPLLYSSGTTGKPKGVARDPAPSPDQTFAGLQAVARFHGYADGGVHLVTGPMYHGAPLGHGAYALLMRQRLVLMERFDARRCLELIERHAVTTAHMVPIMFVRLLRLPAEIRDRYDMSSLTAVYHGAAPCPAWAKRGMIDWLGEIVTEYYGATETGMPTLISSAEWLSRPGSVGTPMPGLEIQVLDEAGDVVPARTEGTIWFKTPQGTPAYLGDAEKTRANQRGDGLFTTGDVGWLDEDGYLYLSDRKIDMIISGGVNIYPAEVEACLSQHPAVADCTVFGVPDDEWGEQVKAAVELSTEAGATEAELIGWCRERIAPFKAPKSVDFHEALPRDDAGKLRKRFLRDSYWAGSGKKI